MFRKSVHDSCHFQYRLFMISSRCNFQNKPKLDRKNTINFRFHMQPDTTTKAVNKIDYIHIVYIAESRGSKLSIHMLRNGRQFFKWQTDI